MLSNFKKIFKTYVNNYSTPLGKPNDNFLNRVYLPRKTENNIMAYLGAHVCTSKTKNIFFDTDAVEAVLDTGCSVTLSSERSDFITYKPTTGQVEGLGVHKIVGTGTVKYTVMDDNGKKVNLLICDSIHVPTLDVRLISVQQLAQQNANPDAGGHVTADYLKLTWDNH